METPEYLEKDITTLRKFLKYTAERYGEKPCICYRADGEIITKTYNDMRNDSLLAASLIYTLTGCKRQHIVIVGKTSYRYLTFLNGIFVCGSVAVPIADSSSAEDIRQLTECSDSTVVICDAFSAANTEKAFANSEHKPIIINLSEVEFPDVCADMPEADPQACAMIMFTSGTTGKKKGVMLSSLAIISNIFFKEMSYEGDNVALNVLPMHHIFCFSCDYLKNLKDGVNICLAGEPSELYNSFLIFEPTFVRLVPMITEGMLKKIKILRKNNPELSPREAGEKVFGRRLRSIISAGARIDPAIGDEFEEMEVLVRQGYGMTETGPRIAVPNGKTDAASAGAIISICETRIRDGELQIKSPSLMLGYYKDEEETAKVFTEDGWFKTGDTAVIKEGNLLYITGRVKNLIILSNGENISPEEIEKKLSVCSLIKEVIVSSENDRITAEIYPDTEETTGMTPKHITEEIGKAITEYNINAASEKGIAKFTIREEPFERTSSGKIIRKKIIFNGGKS